MHNGSIQNDSIPILVSRRSRSNALLVLGARTEGPARLAAERVRSISMTELGLAVEVHDGDVRSQAGDVFAFCPPWDSMSKTMLKKARLDMSADGSLQDLVPAQQPHGDQGFIASRLPTDGGERMLLAANTEIGLRNALLTLADRLYRDAEGNVVADPFDGVSAPAFDTRHIKTDAMNCGPFRTRLEYWDTSSPGGINDFADWLASFRITDYDLLAFVRGWGMSYPSDRFPALTDPQHPNSSLDFYPRLMDRMHAWGVKVWASDIYLASGYSMETAMVPQMLSPCANADTLRPFTAGKGTFDDILHDPEAIACLSHPAAVTFYSDVVKDVLVHYPGLDGLDFHIGHTFPNKICRCSTCGDLAGNREGVYRCFAGAYEAALSLRPDIRLKAAVKMFGDATRKVVERWTEFSHLEFFCWLRWVGNFLIEGADGPVTIGHEDGGGGLEANHDPAKTLTQIRDYFRDYEPWIHTYVRTAKRAQLAGFSWEPVLHRELEHLFFFYSQLTWEPELSWAELARRYVLRSQRCWDKDLIAAYQLALEANAAMSRWGLAAYEFGTSQRMVQHQGLSETSDVRERVAALGDLVSALGLENLASETPPVAFDLRHSLLKTWKRLKVGEVLGQWH